MAIKIYTIVGADLEQQTITITGENIAVSSDMKFIELHDLKDLLDKAYHPQQMAGEPVDSKELYGWYNAVGKIREELGL